MQPRRAEESGRADSPAVPPGKSPPDPSTLEDGRLDELAARHRVTIAEVRHQMNRRRPPPYQYRSGPAPTVDSAKIVALYLEGRTQVDVARLFGGTRQTVARYVRRAGVVGPRPPRRPPRPPAPRPVVDTERIIELYRQGHTQKAVAAIVGCSRKAVVRVVRQAGVVRRGYMPRLDLEEIRRRAEAGQTLAEIGHAIGASSTGVRYAMVRVGIPRRSAGRSPRLDVEEIRRRRQAGQSVAGIARAIGASEIGVAKVVRRYGIPRGPSGPVVRSVLHQP
jgi:transposase